MKQTWIRNLRAQLSSALLALMPLSTLATDPELSAGPAVFYRLTGLIHDSNPNRTASTLSSGLVATQLARGAGLEAVSFSNGKALRNWATAAGGRGQALSGDHYVGFTVTIKGGYRALLDKLTTTIYRPFADSSDQFEWQYSMDEFATAGITAGSVDLRGTAVGADTPTSVDLSGIGQLQGLRAGQQISFRLYGWGAGDASRSTALGRINGPALYAKVFPDSATAPTIATLAATAGDLPAIRIGWDSYPGHHYRLLQSSDLQNWNPAGAGGLQADGYRSSIELVPATSAAFFKIAGSGPEKAPVYEAYFTRASANGNLNDLTLENKITELLDMAEPGTDVRVAYYTWSRTRMSDAFIAAHQRGVNVKIIIGSDYTAVNQMRNQMPGSVITCLRPEGTTGSCHGTLINHNKFILFSALNDGSTHVVLQSSANFTAPQLTNENNAVIVRGDPDLYRAYLNYWQDMARQQRDGNYYWTETFATGNKVYFFPRQSANSDTGELDPICAMLDTLAEKFGYVVESEGPQYRLINPGNAVLNPPIQIHAAQSHWGNPRTGIARRMAELHRIGATVRIIVHEGNSGEQIFAILEAAGITVHRLRTLHSKILLVDYQDGDQRIRHVYTGSHNFTGPSLTSNDEVLLRLNDPALYDQFLDNWQAMFRHPLLETP